MGFYRWRTEAIPMETMTTFTGNNFKYNLVTTLHSKDYERLYGRGSYNFNAIAIIKDFNGHRQLRFGCDQISVNGSYANFYRESNTTKNYYKIIYSDVELPTDYFTPLTTINRVIGTYLLKPTVNIVEDFIASEVGFIKKVGSSVSERLFYNIYTDNGNIYGVYTSEFWSTGSGIFTNHKSVPRYDSTAYSYSDGSNSVGELIYSATNGWQNGYTGEIRFSSVIPIMKVFQDFIDNNSYQKNTNINIFYNDEVLGSLTNSYEIVRAHLSGQNNSYTLVLYDILNNSSVISFDTPVVENKSFMGLGITKRTIDIKPDVDVQINLIGDVNLYLIYDTFRPPTTTFNINLYKCSAELNRVDKTFYLTNVSTISGVLREQTSVITMSVRIEYNEVPNFNYVYIEAFNRYYFVTDITSVRNNIWDISLSVDVLMSYKDGIYMCQAFIDRNENTSNPYLIDTKIPLRTGETINTNIITNELFDSNIGQYVLQGFLVTEGDAITNE